MSILFSIKVLFLKRVLEYLSTYDITTYPHPAWFFCSHIIPESKVKKSSTNIYIYIYHIYITTYERCDTYAVICRATSPILWLAASSVPASTTATHFFMARQRNHSTNCSVCRTNLHVSCSVSVYVSATALTFFVTYTGCRSAVVSRSRYPLCATGLCGPGSRLT